MKRPGDYIARSLVTLALLGFLTVPAAHRSGLSAEEVRGSKGPDGDGLPDLDDVINDKGGRSAALGDDADSLGDLEKVIADEDSKGAPTPKVSGSTADSLDDGGSSGGESAKQTRDEMSSLEGDLQAEAGAGKKGGRNTAATDDPGPMDGDGSAPAKTAENAPATLPDEPVSTEKNTISNLEFRMEGKNSRIVISSRRRLAYREVSNNKNKQFVYIFENTDTPERLQRAYDTTEFPSPVALFTLLQVPGAAVPTSKLIVQLRENQKPSVIANDRGLIIELPPPTEGSDTKVAVNDGNARALLNDNIYSGKQTFSGQIIRRLEIKNSDVQDVLRLIARVSGYSIVVGDDVTGKVGTLSLENIPWDQAFTLVLQSKKLGYVREGNVLRVGTTNTLKAEKDEALAIEQARLKVEPLRTALIPVSYAKASELAPKAKTFMTDRGTVDTDARSNYIIIKDIERVVDRVQKLISALDTPPARVSISAKFVEISRTMTRALGVTNLSANVNPEFAGINISTANALTNGGTSLTTITSSQLGALNLQLQMGEEEHKTRTLANPSISVVANQQAKITQGVSFFIPSNQVANGAVVAGNQQITANLTLDVTPIVSGDGSIFLTVRISNEIPHISGTNTTIDTRSVETQVLIENGDTAVIGGVFHNNIDHDLTGIPLLMRIPILGYLFSSTTDIDDRNELFIFLTGKIMNADEAFKRNL